MWERRILWGSSKSPRRSHKTWVSRSGSETLDKSHFLSVRHRAHLQQKASEPSELQVPFHWHTMRDFQNFNFLKPQILYLSNQERAMDSKNKIRHCSETILLTLPVTLSIKHLLMYLPGSLDSSGMKQLQFSVQLAVSPALPKCRPQGPAAAGVCFGGGGRVMRRGIWAQIQGLRSNPSNPPEIGIPDFGIYFAHTIQDSKQWGIWLTGH